MGQAQRNAGKRRQELAAKRAMVAARQAKSARNKMLAGIVVVVVVAAAVIVGVIVTNNQKNKTADVAIAAKTVKMPGDLPVQRDGGTVLVGKDTAKVTLDVYEDFLCPICGNFESAYGTQMQQQVNDGNLRVRYHIVNLLNDRSDPPGYSTDAANAALCVADRGSNFVNFHASLYSAQPEEGARGYDKGQLTKLGQDVGVTSPSFASCVSNGTYDKAVSDEYQKARTTPYLQQEYQGQKSFGTPTLAVGQTVVDWQDPNWLTKLISQPQ
ncbi:DsbA family protein [Actinocrispum wychmicini]|uniref:Protein-disulfide isomerase n=1 Tax=Actinocrispum wychmicini TaxID=1213861 RepID=A0A4R2JZT2_9PSEU|nr:thioredoxin domain-containing protein [Actinocrispum wychmicini]TCO62946.1 protein-disulfide isomerase [Actinocrispum wychmicini]